MAGGASADRHFSYVDAGTALLRQAPTLNGDAWIGGSVQMMSPENVTLNGSARIWGDLYVPGTPTLKVSKKASYRSILAGTGSASPGSYKVTLNGEARIDDLVRRTDPIEIVDVAAPPAPAGTRSVTIRRESDNVGSWATIRNITLNQDGGSVAIPAGTYGTLTLNRNSTVRLGVPGSTVPTAYNFQKITLNSNARVEIVGPVVITVASIANITSDAVIGNLFHVDWLDFRVASGNVTLASDAYFLGFLRAPRGHVTLNGDASLVGGLEADRLTMNGSSRLSLTQRSTTPPPPPAPDVSITSFDRIDGDSRIPAPTFGEVDAGSTQHFEFGISSPANTASTTATCSATIGGVPASGYTLTWLTQSVELPAGGSGVCAFTLSVAAPAEAVAISVGVTSPADPDASNDSESATLVVSAPVDPALTTNLVVRSITPLDDIFAGTSVEYTAAVGVLDGTQASVEFNCVVTARRVRDGGAVDVTPVAASGVATASTDGNCRFKVPGLTANGSQVETYEFTVHVDPANANELDADDNTLTGTQRVAPPVVDVSVASVLRNSGAGLVPVDSVPAGAASQYVASIAVAGGTTDVACTVNVRPRVSRLGATVISGMSGVMSGPATPADPAECTFSLSLAGNGDFDELYDIEVVAQPVGAVEAGGAPNAISVEQLAIVRVDVALDPITMTVEGVEADPTTIAMGKTGIYHAIIRNNSGRTATLRCNVTVNGSALDLDDALESFTLGAGAARDCSFAITHSTLLVANIAVMASVVSPLDANPANNERQVITTPIGDGHFVGVENATVVANETRLVDEFGNLVELTSATQNMSVTNLALFVTDATYPIGYFKLVGSASSGGVEFSRDSVGGPLDVTDRGIALDPGTVTSPNCIRADRTSPLFKNNHTALLEICASPVPGEPTRQAITVSYTSSKSGAFAASENPALFGSSVVIDVTLSWALKGAPVGVVDQATARVEFDLFEKIQGSLRKKNSNGCFRVLSGTDIVMGGGAGCIP